jgi:hypothetical protein
VISRYNAIKIWAEWKKNKRLRRENIDTYKNSRETLITKLTEWGQRLNGQDFHGGKLPDEADFEVMGYEFIDLLALRTDQDKVELKIFPCFCREKVPREVL